MEIPISKRVRRYELTYLIPVTLSNTEATSAHEQVQALVKKYKGTVVSKEDWGKKPMAYSIKHGGARQTDAHYTHLVLELESTEVNNLDSDVKLNEKIMRHLIVIAEDTAQKEEVTQ